MATFDDHAAGTHRVAIVTGGSHGVGREVTRKLTDTGHAVVVNYMRDQRAADAAIEEILAAKGVALAVRADVADELDVERLFTETAVAFGGVDIVVHAAVRTTCAGAAPRLDHVDALQRINVRGTFVVNREASRRLRRGGAIVNFSDCVVGSAPQTCAAHAAGTSAAEAMTRVFAHQLRSRDVTVNAVAPRLHDPRAVADVVAFLVSAAGSSINGQVICVGASRQTRAPARGPHGRDNER